MKPPKRDKFYRRAPRWYAALLLGSLVFHFHLIAQVVMPGYYSIFAPYAKVTPKEEAPTVSIDWAKDRWFIEAYCTNDLAAASIKTWDFLETFEKVSAFTFVNWEGQYCPVIGAYSTREEANGRHALLIEIGAVSGSSVIVKGEDYLGQRQLDQNGQPYELYQGDFNTLSDDGLY